MGKVRSFSLSYNCTFVVCFCLCTLQGGFRDRWIKEAGPSTELRKWFSHDPVKWNRFRGRYFRELDRNPSTWERLLEASQAGAVTPIYSSHDVEAYPVRRWGAYAEYR